MFLKHIRVKSAAASSFHFVFQNSEIYLCESKNIIVISRFSL